VESKTIDNRLSSTDSLRRMGEHKANSKSKRLLVRLRFPANEPMVVEVGLTAEHLERVWKLMLICEKIRRTVHGRGKVIIEDASCQYISILSEAPIQRLLSMASVTEWHQLQCLWIPDNLLLGRLGQCRVMAGMRKSQTIVEEDSFWLRGHDGAHEFVSVALGRDWINRELARPTR
jgi:hypothetical protein